MKGYRMDHKIIDIHAHPFLTPEQNCGRAHYSALNTPADFLAGMDMAGIGMFAGSVIARTEAVDFEFIKNLNRSALELKKIYGERYAPGVHIHPAYGEESREELYYMHDRGVRLIGELVPYMHGYERYMQDDSGKIFELAQELGMVVSIHPTCVDDIDDFTAAFPRLKTILAHPGEKPTCLENIGLLNKHPNLYLDISGTGLFRDGLLRFLLDETGAEKIMFGADYPICNPAMQIAGVMYENLSDAERECIFHLNAERLLGI